MKTTITILPKILLAVAKAASTDYTRFVINSVRLEPLKGGQCAVLATDGRILFATLLPEGSVEGDEPFFVPTKLIARARLNCAKKAPAARITVGEGRVRIEQDDFEVSCKDEGGNYPNSRQVLPEIREDQFSHLSVNPKVIVKLMSCFEKLGIGDVTMRSH